MATEVKFLTKMEETLIYCVSKSGSSSLKIRSDIFSNLLPPLMNRPEFSGVGVKALTKIVAESLHKYNDRKSRFLVREAIKKLLIHHKEKAIQSLVNMLSYIKVPQTQTSSTMAACFLTPLKWSYLVVTLGFSQSSDCNGLIWEKLVHVQCNLLSTVMMNGSYRVVASAKRLCHSILKTIPGVVSKYLDVISSFPQSPVYLCIIGELFHFAAKTKGFETLKTYKKKMVDLYINTVLAVKVKQDTMYLRASSRFLQHITHEEFKDAILPVIQRSLLRNPEVVIEAIEHLFKDVSIDLSQHATVLCKSLSAHLHSKDDNIREHGSYCMMHLAKQCSDSSAIRNIIEHLFAVLNGSEGKLTVWTDRVGVLRGLKNVSKNAVSGSSALEELSVLVVDKLEAFLQQEVNENVVLESLAALQQWCYYFTNKVPNNLFTSVEKAMSNKKTSSPIRGAYLNCIATACRGNTLHEAMKILPLLLKAVERASSQTHQPSVICEGLTAATILVPLAKVEIQLDSKLNDFWSVLFDSKKSIFTSFKFICNAPHEVLDQIQFLLEKFVSDDEDKFDIDTMGYWFNALVFTMTHTSYGVRDNAKSCFTKFCKLSVDGGLRLQTVLLLEFRELLRIQENPKASLKSECEQSDLSNGITDHGNRSNIPSKVLKSALEDLILIPLKQANADKKQKEAVLLSILQDVNHPSLAMFYPTLWQDLVHKLKMDAEEIVKKNKEQLFDMMTSKTEEQVTPYIVRTLLSVAENVLFDDLVRYVISKLANANLAYVTEEEFGIFQTPDDMLYDKSKIDEIKFQQLMREKNQKKESKAYSYEEQLADIELKKELMRKNGRNESQTMTKKEREAHHAQLEKEKEVRQRLQKIDHDLFRNCLLLKAVVNCDCISIRRHVAMLLQTLVPLFSSLLARRHVVPVFMTLTEAMFHEHTRYIGKRIGCLTLRVHDIRGQSQHDWEDAYVVLGVARVVDDLHKLVVPHDTSDYNASSTYSLPSTTFTCCFPLVRCILKNNGALVAKDKEIQLKTLEILSEHCKLRMDDSDEDETDEYHSETGPSNLPRTEMFSLLSDIIESHSDVIHDSKLQHVACVSMVELAKSASGEIGCTLATDEEINVLLCGLQSNMSTLRLTAMQALQELEMVLPNIDNEDYSKNESQVDQVVLRIWSAKFDDDEETAKLATRLWEKMAYSVQRSLCIGLIPCLVHKVEDIQNSTSLALAEATSHHADMIDTVLDKLITLYESQLKAPEVKIDSLGRVVGDVVQDPWKARRGIARALTDIGTLFTSNELSKLFSFFVPTGLGDRHEEVRSEMLKAALTAVNQLGKDNINTLLGIFEEFLDSALDSSEHDAIRQSVIILMGCLARHLDKEDPKVHPIIVKLLDALSTPSQQVQEAVANCLPPLVAAIKDEAPDIIKNLLNKLLDSTVYGERRGAAYGLAGIVKGLGILSLKQQNIMATLQEAIQDKKHYRHREGALFAFELLCHMLGRLFEPYIVHVLPHLLLCFGDGNQYVRDATDETARAMMRNLSAHGVKLVLPSLLKALKEDAWRTKTGSVELLGAMAYCAPKQLSSCLPNIVPRLTEVLTDSHLKVQKAGVQALQHIGSVIRNPEIQAISPVLLEALSDPSTKTTESLHVLLNTSFVHVIDAASLALIMPIIHRALESRSTETKKMAAQIVGNMYSLTDQKDLNPYLPSVLPGLKQALLDPVPEVRTVAARALGALVKEMSEERCDDLLPWLMSVLTSEGSSVDRSGAAQGLSEVLFGLGFERLEQLMPDVIAATEKTDLAAHVKEGYLMLYLYLPTTFGDEFTPFIGPIIPSILKGLSDESEFVRDTSLKAGQRIVSQYATTAIEVFLPELENGLFDENWRIRISSVQLLGDLLYKISGVTGKMTTEGDEDDNFGTSHSNQAIIDSLGFDRRNRVLSGLYMGRSDVSLPVRQAALHVWKVVVPNTPRVLREILSTLFTLLLGCLASTSHDKRQIAARTLGDLVRKLGERILPEIIPILEKGLQSSKSDERQGVCIGLSEIIDSTSREQVLVYIDSVIPTVRKSLCDALPEVRECAAQTFNNLYKTIGAKALYDIIPDLLLQLADEDLHANTLDGLRQVMSLRSKEVLPLIIPQLVSEPVNAQALASLSTVAGQALTEHLTKILPPLLNSISKASTPEQSTQELEFANTIVLSVQDETGARVVLDVLLGHIKEENVSLRKAALCLLRSFCTSTKTDIIQHTSKLLDNILYCFNDTVSEILEISWETLNVVTKRLDPSEQIQHIPFLRKAVKYAGDEAKNGELRGFCLPKKGITPLLPIFREGILNGSPDVKQDAAEGLGEVIQLTSAVALKPSVVQITGPLIRILGDRFSWNVKVAVLKTLGLLLDKVGVVLKPFLPQLQTTFIKALNDPTRLVRQEASSALQRLIKLHARVDPLFTELHNGIKNTDDDNIRESLLQALRGVLLSVGGKMGEAIRSNLKTTLLGLQGHSEEIIRVASGGCIGALSTILPDEELTDLVQSNIFVSDPTVDWTLRHGRSVALSALFYDCSEKLANLGIFEPLIDLAVNLSNGDRIPICRTGVKCLAYAATNANTIIENIPSGIRTAIIKTFHHSTLEVQVLACDVVFYISKTSPNVDTSFFKPILPELLNLTKEKNTSLKVASELAILSVLKLRNDDTVYQTWLSLLEPSYSSLLAEVYKKSLKKHLENHNDYICELDNPFSSK